MSAGYWFQLAGAGRGGWGQGEVHTEVLWRSVVVVFYFCGTVWLLVVSRETNFCELLGDE